MYPSNLDDLPPLQAGRADRRPFTAVELRHSADQVLVTGGPRSPTESRVDPPLLTMGPAMVRPPI